MLWGEISLIYWPQNKMRRQTFTFCCHEILNVTNAENRNTFFFCTFNYKTRVQVSLGSDQAGGPEQNHNSDQKEKQDDRMKSFSDLMNPDSVHSQTLNHKKLYDRKTYKKVVSSPHVPPLRPSFCSSSTSVCKHPGRGGPVLEVLEELLV